MAEVTLRVDESAELRSACAEIVSLVGDDWGAVPAIIRSNLGHLLDVGSAGDVVTLGVARPGPERSLVIDARPAPRLLAILHALRAWRQSERA